LRLNAVENEMSQVVSLKEQIKKRWMYQFCKDNLPTANLVGARPVSQMRTTNALGNSDEEDVEIGVRTQENTGETAKHAVKINMNKELRGASETDSNTGTDEGDTDASDNETDTKGVTAKIDPSGAEVFDSDTLVEGEEDKSIWVCIGYEFSKLQGMQLFVVIC